MLKKKYQSNYKFKHFKLSSMCVCVCAQQRVSLGNKL